LWQSIKDQHWDNNYPLSTTDTQEYTLAERTNVYEAMIIFDSNRYARERAGLPAEIEKTIQTAAGEVLVSRLWEERRLAYPIAGQRKGTYWLIYFRGPSSMLTALNRQWEIHEGILRHLVLKVHPHLVDAVLEHAKAGPTPPAPVPVAAGRAEVPEVPDFDEEGEP
jgi:small subunit ribosomal protein S6